MYSFREHSFKPGSLTIYTIFYFGSQCYTFFGQKFSLYQAFLDLILSRALACLNFQCIRKR